MNSNLTKIIAATAVGSGMVFVASNLSDNQPKSVVNVVRESDDYSYECSYDAYNCDDFSTHRRAQAVFKACGGVSNDVHGLDRDKDGSACETLP